MHQNPIGRLRRAQADFRREPLGGRLLPVKRLVHWFSASAFDRQAKVVERLIEVTDSLRSRVEYLEGKEPNRTSLTWSPARSDPSGLLPFDPPSDRRPPGDPLGIRRALTSPAHMESSEKLLLYSLVFGTQPTRALEIGTFLGGSADIICAAMDDLDHGHLVCVDPNPRLSDEVRRRIERRATVLSGPSPDSLPQARETAGSDFDLVLVDGDHSSEGVERDIEGVLGVTRPGSLLLFHDSHHDAVRKGIDASLARFTGRLLDCGELSAFANETGAEESNDVSLWGGLRMLRVVG
jgi:hypothetical protein